MVIIDAEIGLHQDRDSKNLAQEEQEEYANSTVDNFKQTFFICFYVC